MEQISQLTKIDMGLPVKTRYFLFQNWCVIRNELPRTCYLLGIAVGRLFDGVALSLYLVSIQFVERLRAISKIHGLGNFGRGNNGQEWEGVISDWLSNHREGVACHIGLSAQCDVCTTLYISYNKLGVDNQIQNSPSQGSRSVPRYPPLMKHVRAKGKLAQRPFKWPANCD